MPQLFRRRSNSIAKLSIILIFGIPAFSFVCFEIYEWSSYETEVGVVISQPVPFSHKHHVGELDIDCRYCHSFVENSSFAGIPSSHVCMSCHSQIWQEAPMLKPVRESFKTQVPIAWNQVYRIPEYVYFDHSIHIQKGVGCTSCHGQIDTMPLTEKFRTFYMRDCLSCHRTPEQFLRPKEQVFSTEYKAPQDQRAVGQGLLQKYSIHKDHLTDCNTCHR